MTERDDPHRGESASDEPARGGDCEAPGVTPRARSRRAPAVATMVGIAALVVLLFAVLVWQPWALRYRRFVSKPLPDGTRYTFLYPAYLQNLQENGKGASPEVAAVAPQTHDGDGNSGHGSPSRQQARARGERLVGHRDPMGA